MSNNNSAFTLWRAFQLTLPRATTGWLFAILQNNFNRVSIVEMGIAAVTITTMIGLFHFLSPFQVVFGHLSDRFPIFGYRRSPYILAGITLSGVAVSVLPDIGILISQDVTWAYFAGVGAMAMFGVGFAMSGVTHLALVADVAPPKYRGPVIASIWVMLLVGMITSLAFIRWYMPDYDLETMRELYALSIPIVFVLTLLGLLGIEKRVSKQEAEELRVEAEQRIHQEKQSAPKFVEFLRSAFSNTSTRSFFLFIFVTTLGVGLQDTILEVFGANVLGMSVGETGLFEQVLRGGALVGMIAMGVISFKWGISKLKAIVFGAYGYAFFICVIAYAGIITNKDLVIYSLVLAGLAQGFYIVGVLTTMMEMTTDHERGSYMGLWGLALTIGNGFAAIAAGAMVTGLIETQLLGQAQGYAAIFVLEGLILIYGISFIHKVDSSRFSRIGKGQLTGALEADVS